MIDLSKEKPITLGAAARQLGKSLETLHNWRRRRVLECVRMGGWWYTTDAAINRMAARQTTREEAGEQDVVRAARTPRVVNKQHDEAMEYLRSVGAA